jgi:flagellar basal body-associated protein FliL
VPSFGGPNRQGVSISNAFIDQIVQDSLAFQNQEAAHVAQMGAADGEVDAAIYLTNYAEKFAQKAAHGRKQVRDAIIRNIAAQEQQQIQRQQNQKKGGKGSGQS